MDNVLPLERAPRHTERSPLGKPPALPFIKWAGGKRAIIQDLKRYFPEHIDTYWEPFVGGGAVFFAIADRIGRATLSDSNEELILTYQVVKDKVDALIDALRVHETKHNKDESYYLRVRSQTPKPDIAIAARFIYLNKTCFNGLYRVNKKGAFNVPKGRYKNPSICNEIALRTASKVLAKATIRVGDFGKIVKPSKGSFIYCDPPYDDCFTEYQAGGFSNTDQERLRDLADGWIKRDANVILSNSDTPLIRQLYKDKKTYKLHKTEAPRNINSKAEERKSAAELIITSHYKS